MNNFIKIGMGVLALSAAASFAGNYPFPQNMKYPHGTIIEYADTEMIKTHYEKWKRGWYSASQGWVFAPDGTCSTVSEAIAYGMLISVYMDDEDVFKKLYNTWKTNSNNGGGMNWRVGCKEGSGSASDADFDAALAFVMASKQWGGNYLNDAKTLISWIASNDINSNKIKPGSQWNDAFNPSYSTTANFQLFQDVAGGSWSSVISQTYTELSACQDSKTGLVPDWCDWNSHKPRSTSAAVSNDIGFYDDAARTPWRMAMAYYWYGDTKAQAFNKKVVDWLIPTTRTASGVNSGYKWVEKDGSGSYVVDDSEIRHFVSSTFSGGLGLATSSFDTPEAVEYLGTVYKVLKEKVSCENAEACGQSVAGEKYYPATLNMLYLLLVTGNMPNLYNTAGYEKFTPDSTKAPSVKGGDGEQQEIGDTTVGISGFWKWGAYHDKLGIGTTMVPDSGTSPLYKLSDGSIVATASMEIGPEPDWTPEAAAAGTLKYPSAGIAMSFLDSEEGVDLTALGVKAIRLTYKSQGPMRFALLNTSIPSPGTEPGCYLPTTDNYKKLTFNLKIDKNGIDTDECSSDGLVYLDWIRKDNKDVPEELVMKTASGVKFEVKDAAGGIGSISIRGLEFLDASGNVVEPSKITGIVVPEVIVDDPIIDEPQFARKSAVLSSAAKISVSGMNISVDGAKAGADISVFSLQGKKVASTKAIFGNASVNVPTKGVYLVRVGNKLSKVNVK